MKKLTIFNNKNNEFCYVSDANCFGFQNIIKMNGNKPDIYQYLTYIMLPEENIDNVYAIKLNDIIGYIFKVNVYDNDLWFLAAHEKPCNKMECANNWVRVNHIPEPRFNNQLQLSKIKNDIKEEEGTLINE